MQTGRQTHTNTRPPAVAQPAHTESFPDVHTGLTSGRSRGTSGAGCTVASGAAERRMDRVPAAGCTGIWDRADVGVCKAALNGQ